MQFLCLLCSFMNGPLSLSLSHAFIPSFICVPAGVPPLHVQATRGRLPAHQTAGASHECFGSFEEIRRVTMRVCVYIYVHMYVQEDVCESARIFIRRSARQRQRFHSSVTKPRHEQDSSPYPRQCTRRRPRAPHASVVLRRVSGGMSCTPAYTDRRNCEPVSIE